MTQEEIHSTVPRTEPQHVIWEGRRSPESSRSLEGIVGVGDGACRGVDDDKQCVNDDEMVMDEQSCVKTLPKT